VVPFSITSNPDDPKVFDIYAVEAESAIVLLTIDNRTDIYATVYDTKTKNSHEPVLIFHSDSGPIHPTVCRENETCPMGSIVVQGEGVDYAVALGKNEMNANIDPVCYDGEEIWIISNIEEDFESSHDLLTLESRCFPYSIQSAQQIRLMGFTEDEVIYEGVLSIDLAIANIDSKLIMRSNYRGAYLISHNSNKTKLEFH
jgi:hypothetical protein